MSDNENLYDNLDNLGDDFEDDGSDVDDKSEGDDHVVGKDEEEKLNEKTKNSNTGDSDDESDDDGSNKGSDNEEDDLISTIAEAGQIEEMNRNNPLFGLKELKGDQRITVPFLQKFEKAKLLSTRARQIANGAKTKIPIPLLKKRDSLSIAKQELEMKVIPNKIVRKNLQLKTYEIWTITDFKYIERD